MNNGIPVLPYNMSGSPFFPLLFASAQPFHLLTSCSFVFLLSFCLVFVDDSLLCSLSCFIFSSVSSLQTPHKDLHRTGTRVCGLLASLCLSCVFACPFCGLSHVGARGEIWCSLFSLSGLIDVLNSIPFQDGGSCNANWRSWTLIWLRATRCCLSLLLVSSIKSDPQHFTDFVSTLGVCVSQECDVNHQTRSV
jgi:hypothetical protein